MCEFCGVWIISIKLSTVILGKTRRLARRRRWHPTPWTEEPGGLQSMGSQRVRHSWATSLSLFTFMHWRRQWHPTPVLLPGKSHGWRSLVGYSPWGRKESDTTEWLHFHWQVEREWIEGFGNTKIKMINRKGGKWSWELNMHGLKYWRTYWNNPLRGWFSNFSTNL